MVNVVAHISEVSLIQYANIVDPDQTALKEQSDQGLPCLLSKSHLESI